MTATALVTGGSGFLGRRVVRALAAAGTPAVALDLRRVEGVDTIEWDLAEGPAPLEARTIGTAYHLAGLAHVVPRSEEDGARFYAVNHRGTENLLRGLEGAEGLEAVVLVSTVAVYGRDRGEGLDESTEAAARDPYGRSKRLAEEAVLEWCGRRGVRAGVVRLPLVTGAGAPGNLGAMVSALRRGRYVGVGDGSARRSMVLASDVAEVLPRVAEVGGVFHLTDGHHPSFRELEAALCAALGRRLPLRLPLAAAMALGAVGDVVRAAGLPAPVTRATIGKMTATLTFSDERARSELGWRPRRVVDAAAELVA